jgi:hypothetical protein
MSEEKKLQQQSELADETMEDVAGGVPRRRSTSASVETQSAIGSIDMVAGAEINAAPPITIWG